MKLVSNILRALGFDPDNNSGWITNQEHEWAPEETNSTNLHRDDRPEFEKKPRDYHRPSVDKEADNQDQVYVTYDGDNVGAEVEESLMRDETETATRLSANIRKTHEQITEEAEHEGGKLIFDGGDNGMLLVPESAVSKISERIRELYKKITGHTVSIGVGGGPIRAHKALVYAKNTGKDKIVTYSEALEPEIKKIKDKQKELEPIYEATKYKAAGRSPEFGDAYWVDPDGKIFEVVGAHHDWAAKNRDLLEEEYGLSASDPDRLFYDLLDNGWIRAQVTPHELAMQIGMLSEPPNSIEQAVHSLWKEGLEVSIGDESERVVIPHPEKSIMPQYQRQLKKTVYAVKASKESARAQIVRILLQSGPEGILSEDLLNSFMAMSTEHSIPFESVMDIYEGLLEHGQVFEQGDRTIIKGANLKQTGANLEQVRALVPNSSCLSYSSTVLGNGTLPRTVAEKTEADLPFLSNKGVEKVIPMFVDKDTPDDHKCGTCVFRVGSNRCARVEGEISFDKGTCDYWAEGKGMTEKDISSELMDWTTAGYVEAPDPGFKIQCGTCEFLKDSDESVGTCTLWQGRVKVGQCCMAYDNASVVAPSAAQGGQYSNSLGLVNAGIKSPNSHPVYFYSKNIRGQSPTKKADDDLALPVSDDMVWLLDHEASASGPCERCLANEGKTPQETNDMIPLHDHCKCRWGVAGIPVPDTGALPDDYQELMRTQENNLEGLEPISSKSSFRPLAHCGPCTPLKMKAIEILSDLSFKDSKALNPTDLPDLAKLTPEASPKNFATRLGQAVAGLDASKHGDIVDKLTQIQMELNEIATELESGEMKAVDKQGALDTEAWFLSPSGEIIPVDTHGDYVLKNLPLDPELKRQWEETPRKDKARFYSNNVFPELLEQGWIRLRRYETDLNIEAKTFEESKRAEDFVYSLLDRLTVVILVTREDQKFSKVSSDQLREQGWSAFRQRFKQSNLAITAHIRHEKGKWVVYNHDYTKSLGHYDTKEEAEKRLRQIEYFKHKGGKSMKIEAQTPIELINVENKGDHFVAEVKIPRSATRHHDLRQLNKFLKSWVKANGPSMVPAIAQQLGAAEQQIQFDPEQDEFFPNVTDESVTFDANFLTTGAPDEPVVIEEAQEPGKEWRPWRSAMTTDRVLVRGKYNSTLNRFEVSAGRNDFTLTNSEVSVQEQVCKVASLTDAVKFVEMMKANVDQLVEIAVVKKADNKIMVHCKKCGQTFYTSPDSGIYECPDCWSKQASEDCPYCGKDKELYTHEHCRPGKTSEQEDNITEYERSQQYLSSPGRPKGPQQLEAADQPKCERCGGTGIDPDGGGDCSLCSGVGHPHIPEAKKEVGDPASGVSEALRNRDWEIEHVGGGKFKCLYDAGPGGIRSFVATKQQLTELLLLEETADESYTGSDPATEGDAAADKLNAFVDKMEADSGWYTEGDTAEKEAGDISDPKAHTYIAETDLGTTCKLCGAPKNSHEGAQKVAFDTEEAEEELNDFIQEQGKKKYSPKTIVEMIMDQYRGDDVLKYAEAFIGNEFDLRQYVEDVLTVEEDETPEETVESTKKEADDAGTPPSSPAPDGFKWAWEPASSSWILVQTNSSAY